MIRIYLPTSKHAKAILIFKLVGEEVLQFTRKVIATSYSGISLCDVLYSISIPISYQGTAIFL